MQDKQYKVLLNEMRNVGKRVSQTEEGISRIDADLAKDRKDIDDFKLQLEKIEGQLDNVSAQIARFSGKTREVIQDAVTESIQPVSDQMDAFVEKKVLNRNIYHFSIKLWIQNIWKMVKGVKI